MIADNDEYYASGSGRNSQLHERQGHAIYSELVDAVKTQLRDAFFGTLEKDGKPVPAWMIAEIVAHTARMTVLNMFHMNGDDARTNAPPELFRVA